MVILSFLLFFFIKIYFSTGIYIYILDAMGKKINFHRRCKKEITDPTIVMMPRETPKIGHPFAQNYVKEQKDK